MSKGDEIVELLESVPYEEIRTVQSEIYDILKSKRKRYSKKVIRGLSRGDTITVNDKGAEFKATVVDPKRTRVIVEQLSNGKRWRVPGSMIKEVHEPEPEVSFV